MNNDIKAVNTAPTKVFLDTEFTGLIQDTTLLSLAMLTLGEHYFYAELTVFNEQQLQLLEDKHQFRPEFSLQEMAANTVLRKGKGTLVKGDPAFVAAQLVLFLKPLGSIEIWADCPAYDWVLFRNLFEDAFYLPIDIQNYCNPFDLQTFLHLKGMDYNITREELIEDQITKIPVPRRKHHALWDVWVTRLCWERLNKM